MPLYLKQKIKFKPHNKLDSEATYCTTTDCSLLQEKKKNIRRIILKKNFI